MKENDGCSEIILWSLMFALVVGVAIQAFKLFVLFVLIPTLAIFISFHLLRFLYHAINPEAKKAFLARREKEAKAQAQAFTEARIKNEREKRKRKIEEKERELQRRAHRDSDQQSTPYTYEIGRHANESLAIRYGIANQERKTKEYWYYAKGGEKRRNPDRDRVFYEPAREIRLQKTKKIGENLYEVLLSDFRNRKARAIIETGTEYVKTFYPLDDNWFKEHAALENALKGNNSFTLKELATFHVQKAVGK